MSLLDRLLDRAAAARAKVPPAEENGEGGCCGPRLVPDDTSADVGQAADDPAQVRPDGQHR